MLKCFIKIYYESKWLSQFTVIKVYTTEKYYTIQKEMAKEYFQITVNIILTFFHIYFQHMNFNCPSF